MRFRLRFRFAGVMRVLRLRRLDFPPALRRRPVGKVAASGLAGVRMHRSVVPVAVWVVACVRHEPASERPILPEKELTAR